jgi:SAM-dependent methyltransferase
VIGRNLFSFFFVSFVIFASSWSPSAQGLAADISAGKTVVEGSGGCLSCHSLDGRGAKAARELSWIGLLRTRAALREVLAREPHAAKVPPGEIDKVAAYLRTLRSLPPSVPSERTREVAPLSENVGFFNRPERAAEEKTDALIDALDIRDGDRVADIGAGTGFFTWRLAKHAGARGKVLAVDIQQSMLERAAAAMKERGVTNVDYVLATERDPKLPPRSLDMVFIAHSYHEFTEPETMIEAVRRSLNPAGRLVIVEYAKEKRAAPASPLHKMSFDEIRTEIEPLGFELEQILDFLPMQHALIFSVR